VRGRPATDVRCHRAMADSGAACAGCFACSAASGSCAPATGTPCNDGDACTLVDTCRNGTCVGASPLTCTATDECHRSGNCNSGTCSNPLAPANTRCSAPSGGVCLNGTCGCGPGTTLCGGTCVPNDQLITTASDTTVTEEFAANWAVGGACSPNTVRESYAITMLSPNGTGTCGGTLLDWGSLGNSSTPARSDTIAPLLTSDARFCGVVIGVVSASCRVVIRQRRVCP
jgi:hypothetical protein